MGMGFFYLRSGTDTQPPFSYRSTPRVPAPRGDPGAIELAIPRLRQGSYFPGWLSVAAAAGRGGVDQRGGDLLPAGGLHPADGPAGAHAGNAAASSRQGKTTLTAGITLGRL